MRLGVYKQSGGGQRSSLGFFDGFLFFHYSSCLCVNHLCLKYSRAGCIHTIGGLEIETIAL